LKADGSIDHDVGHGAENGFNTGSSCGFRQNSTIAEKERLNFASVEAAQRRQEGVLAATDPITAGVQE